MSVGTITSARTASATAYNTLTLMSSGVTTTAGIAPPEVLDDVSEVLDDVSAGEWKWRHPEHRKNDRILGAIYDRTNSATPIRFNGMSKRSDGKETFFHFNTTADGTYSYNSSYSVDRVGAHVTPSPAEARAEVERVWTLMGEGGDAIGLLGWPDPNHADIKRFQSVITSILRTKEGWRVRGRNGDGGSGGEFSYTVAKDGKHAYSDPFDIVRLPGVLKNP